MRIIFMGTPALAAAPLETLLATDHEILAVFTQPDRASGRGRNVSFSAVKECALAHGIPVYQPDSLQENAVLDQIEALQADLICVVAYAQKVPDRLLAMPPFGCINLHPSLLPKYRGSAPFRGPILNGDPESGVTIMQLSSRWDAGDILLQERFPLDTKETAVTLEAKAVTLGAKLLLQAVEGLEAGTLTPTPQDEAQATYLKQIKKEEGKIRFSDPAVQIERQIRACIPWPSAYTTLEGKLFKIWEAEVVSMDEFASEKASEGKDPAVLQSKDAQPEAPGTVAAVSKDRLVLACGRDYLNLKEVQIEGKKRMTVSDFLKGKKIEQGTIFGTE